MVSPYLLQCMRERHGGSVLARFDVTDARENERAFRLSDNLSPDGPGDADYCKHDN